MINQIPKSIKIFVLIGCLIMFCLPVWAQKVVQKGDIVYINQNPYAQVTKEKYGFRRIYKIKTLNNRIVLLITKETNSHYYELTFVESNEKAYISISNVFMTNRLERIFRQLYNDQVIVDNGINNNGKAIFLMLNSQIPYDPVQYHNHLNNR